MFDTISSNIKKIEAYFQDGIIFTSYVQVSHCSILTCWVPSESVRIQGWPGFFAAAFPWKVFPLLLALRPARGADDG